MSANLTEEEQIESIKQWWGQYGRAIIVGIIIGALAIWGWRYWSDHRETMRQSASTDYYELINAIQTENSDAVVTQANLLMDDYPGTNYASYAALLLAKQSINADDLSVAIVPLQWVLDNSTDSFLTAVAQGRLARLQLSENQLDTALATLDTIDMDSQYVSVLFEIKGDILLAMDDSDAARTAYQSAITQAALLRQTGDLQLLQFKLNDLTVGTVSPAQSIEDGVS